MKAFGNSIDLLSIWESVNSPVLYGVFRQMIINQVNETPSTATLSWGELGYGVTEEGYSVALMPLLCGFSISFLNLASFSIPQCCRVNLS